MAESQEAPAALPKVTLYWLEQSRSQRFVWLLEECTGLDYSIETFKRTSEMLAPPKLQKAHPLGKAPIVSIEAPALSQPLVLAESGSIAEYLCDHFAPHLVPTRYAPGKENQVGGETEEWLRYRYYMHYAEGSLTSLLVLCFIIDSLHGPQVPFLIRPITKQIVGRIYAMFLGKNLKTHFSFLESQVATAPGGGPYLCGATLTAADIMMSFPLTWARSRLDKKQYPKLVEYLDTLDKHPTHVQSTAKIEKVTGRPLSMSV